MKKRIVVLILTICLSTALCACGSTKAISTSGSSNKDEAAVVMILGTSGQRS